MEQEIYGGKDEIWDQDGTSDESQFIPLFLKKPTAQFVQDHFQRLLTHSSQPRNASEYSCVKLCYFIEQCRKSDSKILHEFAFSKATCLTLVTFYIEWNEKNQHRSLRLVLELISTLISTNPENSIAMSIKIQILRKTLSIIAHHLALPLVKPALKVLEFFLNKSVVSTMELAHVLGEISTNADSESISAELPGANEMVQLDFCVSSIFEWMCLPETSPAAGKLLVTLFKELKKPSSENSSQDPNAYITLWYRWIRRGLSMHPASIDNIKNHFFSPLFKLDRSGSFEFLYYLTTKTTTDVLECEALSAQALLLLSAIEVGKKFGLVDTPDTCFSGRPSNARTYVLFPEETIASLLGHPSSSIRASSFAVLISSTFSTKPFPISVLVVMQQHLSILHSDSDARFRNAFLSNIKHMIGRLKGAISYLNREQKALSISKMPKQISGPRSSAGNETIIPSDNRRLSDELNPPYEIMLEHHIYFIKWYLDFILNELIPTSAYQRHITALKALHLILKSGVIETGPPDDNPSNHVQQAWPLTITFFTQKAVRLLLDLLVDPFEDVRTSAISILKLAPHDAFSKRDSFSFAKEELPYISNLQSPSTTIKESGIYGDEYVGLRKCDFKGATIPSLLISFIESAEERSLRTGRADFADGVAHSYELLCALLATDHARFRLVQHLVKTLETKISVSEVDLAQAVRLAPVHGYFASLRFVWDILGETSERALLSSSSSSKFTSFYERDNGVWEDLQSRIVKCCERIWIAVEKILCNDSPEGHIPQEFDDVHAVDTKDVLSYSFRAIHESSNLLCMMVGKSKHATLSHYLSLPFKLFCIIGNLCFQQLSNLRHRGAFSTVSLTFTRCCQLTTTYGNLGVRLLDGWYQGTIACINQQTSTTRRSAGIPALMCGILCAKPLEVLDEALSELKSLAKYSSLNLGRDKIGSPQVHAMNCLKEIFKSSTLGRKCENHITDCLQIAAESLRSETWAIRNCGLLLLRSLIDCLFGTNESKVVTEAGWDGRSVRLSYERYPTLPDLLLHLLRPEFEGGKSNDFIGIGAVESVFPALDIIRRAGPLERLRDEIYKCVSNHLASNIWHIRDIAARTICTLLLHNNWLRPTLDLLETCGNSTNRHHGILLSIKYLLERRLELRALTKPGDLLLLSNKIYDNYYLWQSCSISEGMYEEIMVTLLKFIYQFAQDKSMHSKPEILALKNKLSAGNAVEKACAIIQREHSPFTNDTDYRTGTIVLSGCSSLLQSALVFRALYTVAIDGRISDLESIVETSARLDPDITRALLEHLSFVWDVHRVPAEVLLEILKLYVVIYTSTTSNEVRGTVLRRLSDILEQLLKLRRQQSTDQLQFLRSLITQKGSPDLLCAEIQITGPLMALDVISARENNWSGDYFERIEEWGQMLLAVGKADNDFDARFAAVSALRCFYHPSSLNLPELHNKSSFVPSLLALYDALNDDDEDIRAEGAEVVSRMFGMCLVPLAAASKLLRWLEQNLGDTQTFRIASVQRITGSECLIGLSRFHCEPVTVEKQLEVALLSNNSLFVEEEQNLYRDEVREAIAWNSIIISSKRPFWKEVMSYLSLWALEGILVLTRLSETRDGPLGQTSTPSVFSICMRVILIAKAAASYPIGEYTGDYSEILYSRGKSKKESATISIQQIQQRQENLRHAIDHLSKIGICNNLHPVLLDALLK